MNVIRIILGVIGAGCLLKGGICFTRSTDSMLDRGAGFSSGDGSGMSGSEVKQFEAGLKWLAVGGVLLFISIEYME